jgi:hypothetical protein
MRRKHSVSRIDALLKHYASYVALPWDHSLPGAQRIWFAVYDKMDERRLRRRIPDFEIETVKASCGWRSCDLTDAFAHWMAGQNYREAYFETPADLGSPHPAFEEYVAERVRRELDAADDGTVVGIIGAGALFGFMKISILMGKIDRSIHGRLLVFFPGEYADNNYRLLDARDGWNYHAVPITAGGGLLNT